MEDKARVSMEKLVYDKIKKAILLRELSPGTQLVESTISEKMNVSRTPIRNAIRKLAHEGLITIIANRGAFVIQPTAEEIFQAYEARIELECSSARLSINNLTDDDIQLLKELVEKENKAFKEKDIFKFVEANEKFHMIIVNGSKNKFLMEFTNKIVNQINIYLQLYDSFYNIDFKESGSVREHTEIINLIENKDVLMLQDALRKHIKNSYDDLQINKVAYRNLNDIF